jgi:hypothetical protein
VILEVVYAILVKPVFLALLHCFLGLGDKFRYSIYGYSSGRDSEEGLQTTAIIQSTLDVM